mgnify:CR=1 FL=1
MKNRKQNFWLTLAPLLLLIAIQMGVSIFAQELTFVVGIYQNQDLTYTQLMEALYKTLTNTLFYDAMLLIYAVIAFAILSIWYYCFKKEGNFDFVSEGGIREVITNTKDSLKGYSKLLIPGVLVTGFGMQVVMEYFQSALSMQFPNWLVDYQRALDNIGLGKSFSGQTVLIIYMILGPVVEELAFRGLTFGYARRRMSFWAANILQALFFAIFHMNMLQGVMAFFVGLLLGYIYGKCKNIFVVIFLHWSFNGFSFVIQQVDLTRVSPILFCICLITCMMMIYLGAKLILYSFPKGVKEKAEDTDIHLRKF